MVSKAAQLYILLLSNGFEPHQALHIGGFLPNLSGAYFFLLWQFTWYNRKPGLLTIFSEFDFHWESGNLYLGNECSWIVNSILPKSHLLLVMHEI